MSDIVVPKKNYLVAQSNDLIDARYPTPLTLNEKKIILMMISLIQPNDEEFKTYTLPVKYYTRLLGLDEKTEPYGYLRKLMKNLMQRVLEIPTKEGWLLTHWVSNCELLRKKGEISFTFDPKLKPYLLQLKREYTQYQLANVLPLTSVYSISIYELLKKWEKVGQIAFDIDDFRISIGATKPTYKKYAQLNSKILEPSKNEISEKTDISYSVETIKRGNKVERLVFTIHKSSKKKLSKKSSTNGEFLQLLALKLRQITRRFELKENVLDILLEQGRFIWRDDENIHSRFENELIALCSYVEQEKKIENPIGFIRWSFNEALTQDNPTFTTLSPGRKESIPDWLLPKSDNSPQEDKVEGSNETLPSNIDYEYVSKLIAKKLDGTLTEDEEKYLNSLVPS